PYVADAKTEAVVDFDLHPAHAVFGRKDLDTQERRLRKDLLIRLRPYDHTNIGHAIKRGRQLDTLLNNREDPEFLPSLPQDIPQFLLADVVTLFSLVSFLHHT